MNDALRQLRDVHLPEAPHWWPPAPGWWLLALVLLVVVGILLIHRRRRALRRLPFKAARSELTDLLRDRHVDDGTFADRANALIKRTLIHGLRSPEAAALSGAAWLQHLDGYMDRPCFGSEHDAILGDARFAPGLSVDRARLGRDIEALLARLEQRA